MESSKFGTFIPNAGTRWKEMFRMTPHLLLLRKEHFICLSRRRLVGFQSRSGNFREETNFMFLRGIELQFIFPSDRSLFIVAY
jgi:hypothetical protein